MIRTIEEEKGRIKDSGFTPIGELSVSTEAAAGDVKRDKLRIRSGGTKRLVGDIFVTNPRIRVKEKKIRGSEIEIPYLVNLEGLVPGEAAEGKILFSTNDGEYSVPVRVAASEMKLMSGGREIRDLGEFTELAEQNPGEALRIFESAGFQRLLSGETTRVRALAAALTKSPSLRGNMEEFLVLAGRKEPVRLTVNAKEREFPAVSSSEKELLRIVKSGWGCTEIRVSAEGDFLGLPKDRFTEEDFFGSVLDVEYIVRQEKLHPGKNFGKIKVVCPDGIFELPVTASPLLARDAAEEPDTKKIRVRLMRDLIDFHIGVRSADEFANRVRKNIAAWPGGQAPAAMQLLAVYAEEKAGRHERALELLRGVSSHDFTGEPAYVKAGFLYIGLMTGQLTKDEQSIIDRIREWQTRNREDVLLTLMRMQIDPSVTRLPDRQNVYFYELFDAGVMSPLLYLSALKYYEQYPELFTRVDPFMWHMLAWGAKNRYLPEELALKVSYLTISDRKTASVALRVLKAAFAMYDRDAILTAICRILIRFAPGDAESFPWFLMAVEREIQITRLYASFIEAVPENYREPLPRVILHYLAREAQVSEKKRAFLYASVVKNRTRDPETYAALKDQMQEFADASFLGKRIGRDYAVLYRNFQGNIGETERGVRLAENIFTERLYTDDPRVREAVVYHYGLKNPEIYPLRGGEALVQCWTDDAAILFSDGRGRYFASSVVYTREPLMEKEPQLSALIAFGIPYPGLWLSAAVRNGQLRPVDVRTVDAFRQMEASSLFADGFRDTVRKMLLTYYLDHAENETIDRYLSEIDLDAYARVDRARFITLLIRRGFSEAAFELLRRCGAEGVKPEELLACADAMEELFDGAYDETLLFISMQALRGGAVSESSLFYLERWFDGAVADMLLIRQHLAEFDIRSGNLDDRILRRAVFTGTLLPRESGVLGAYERLAGNPEVSSAYADFECERTFGKGELISSDTASLVAALIDRGVPVPEADRLALLNYYAKKKKRTAREEIRMDVLLEECVAKGLYFPFFRELPASSLRQYHLEDKAFVFVQAEPGDEVDLIYALAGRGEEKHFRRAPLREIYRGLFGREFILFYGEELTWSAVVHHEGEERKLPEKVETAGHVDDTGVSRYQLLNQMLAAKEKGDTETLENKIRELRRAELVTGALFKLEEEP